MKRFFIAGALVAALGAGAYAQAGGGQPAPRKGAAGADQAGHTQPNPQPPTETSPAVPEGEVKLGSVHIPKGVKANGQPLAAGTYQVTLTPQTAQQAAPGQTPSKERWVEFSKAGKVAGKEVAIVVPQSEISKVEKDKPPAPNSSKVETLKGGDYVRLWINHGGNHVLVYLPAT